MNVSRSAAQTTDGAASSRGGSAFRPGFALTVQVAVAVAVVLALAAWQFSRGLEKTALKNAHAERLRSEPVAAAGDTAAVPDFTRLTFAGRFDAERTFLVADQVGRPVQVVSAFRTQDDVFLVNRGWLSSAAAQLPEKPAFETPANLVEIVGVAWPTGAVSPWLAAQPWPDGWPKQVRGIDVARMANEVGAHAREIRLERGQPGVLRPVSLAWDFSPGTHWGYVGQWLLIGVALVAGYIVIGKRRGRRAADGVPLA